MAGQQVGEWYNGGHETKKWAISFIAAVERKAKRHGMEKGEKFMLASEETGGRKRQERDNKRIEPKEVKYDMKEGKEKLC